MVWVQRVVVLACAWLMLGGVAAAQPASRCADCHVANRVERGGHHLGEWDRSAHGRARVGCEKCHGGNPATFEQPAAHRGMLPPANERSPVHRANLPKTCGSCHVGQRVAFEKTKHFQLLASGDGRGSTCSTCHNEVGDTLLSPKALEVQCNACHGPGGTAPRPERARDARLALEDVHEARVLLKEARDVIRQVKDPARRTALGQEATGVERDLAQAVEAGHAFVYDGLRDRVAEGRRKLGALFDHLTAPAATPRSGK
jgi:hypothetical protein